MTGPTLRRNFAWVFTGSLILALTQLGLQIALTKLAPDEKSGAARVGDWTLAMSVTGPIFVFFLFKLRALQATDARNEHGWPAYATVRLLGMLGALATTIVVVAAGYRDRTAPIILGVALMKAFNLGANRVLPAVGAARRTDQDAS